MSTQINISSSGFKLEGTNYISVLAQGTPAQNGQAVKDAVTFASNMTPNGNPLSNTNRATILLAPGRYTFNEAVDGQFYVIPLYVDFESLSGEPDVFFSSLEVGNFGGFVNTRITGIDTTKNSYYGHGAFAVSSTGGVNESITIKNCVGGEYSFSSFSSGFMGTYENCKAGDFSFGSTGDGITPPAGITGVPTAFLGFNNYGTIKNCVSTGIFSFCTGFIPNSYAINWSLIENCTSGGSSFCCSVTSLAKNNGTIKNCDDTTGISSGYSFCVVYSGTTGKQAVNNGIIINCTGSSNSFCVNDGTWTTNSAAVNAGTIRECHSGSNSFVCNVNYSNGEQSGTIINCSAVNGNNCFGGNSGLIGGDIINCVANNNSFANQTPGNIYESVLRCTLRSDTFTVGVTGGGRVVLGIDNTGIVNY
jgi:hypothetical protein